MGFEPWILKTRCRHFNCYAWLFPIIINYTRYSLFKKIPKCTIQCHKMSNHYQYPHRKLSVITNRDSICLKQQLCFSSSLLFLVTCISAFYKSAHFRYLLQWNHAMLISPCLGYFISYKRSIFKVDLCCSICQDFILSCGCIPFHCPTLGLFHLLDIVSQNTGLQV